MLDPTRNSPPLGVFQLHTEAHSDGSLRVLSFRGKEQVSKPYAFEIVFAAPTLEHPRAGAELLGQAATLSLFDPESGGRAVQGILRRVERDTSRGPAGASFRATLAPRFWLLGRGKRSRIFQEMTVTDIAHEIFEEHHIAAKITTVRTLARRPYTVQYEESDAHFLHRLFAEEGLFYSFEHPERALSSEILVMRDSADLCRPIPGDPTLLYRETIGLKEAENHVRDWRVEERVAPGTVLLRDFDFTRPHFDVSAKAAIPHTTEGFDSRAMDVYEHQGDFERSGLDPKIAKLRLDQYRRKTRIATATSRCPRLLPGSWFELQGASAFEGESRATILQIEHEGHTPEIAGASGDVYKNQFTAIQASIAPLPKAPKRRARQIMETATVVGPKGQDIHTDAHGRIRVQFHWDLEGKRDARSSCFIRVMQGWAGAGFGFQFLPRIGMEVVVLFASGDTDRPMVIGCAYNGAHPFPFALPGYKSKSGIVTRTTRGGAGYNELSFEDRPGFERVHIHAERDFDTVVGRNETIAVGASQTTHVAANAVTLIGEDELHSVGGNRRHNIAGNEASVVEGNRHNTTRGDCVEAFDGRLERRVQREVVTHVEGASRHFMQGECEAHLAQTCTVRAEGAVTALVGKHDARRSLTLRVEGTADLSSSDTMELSSEKDIVLRCGKSTLRIAPDHVEISSPRLYLQGEGASAALGKDELILHGKTRALLLSDQKVFLKAIGATLSLTAEAKIDGAQIKLKAPDNESVEGGPGERKTTLIELKDQEGKPLAYQRYLMIFSDGRERGGLLDRNGKAEVELAEDATIVFPDLSDVEEA